MNVRVRIFGYLKKYCKKPSPSVLQVTVAEKATAKDLLKCLNISEEEVILLINDVYCHQKERELKENDMVWIYPPFDGG